MNVIGTPLAVTTYDELTAECQRLTKNPHPSTIDLTNTQIATMRRHEPAFRELTSEVDYFIPDGMPLIWVMNRRGAKLTDRVYGPKFMQHLVRKSPAPFTHYFLGGSPECLAALEDRFKKAQPDLIVAGRRHGYFKSEDEEEILQEINLLSPDFIWVGLGTPKQQAWIHRHKARIKRGVILAVGFAFDVNAGTKSDAPAWMQRRGLTWLYRVGREPRRLLGRYLRYNSLFLFYLLRETLAGKSTR